jgi:hypothetical protein
MGSNRREALKTILIYAGGVLLLPSCLKNEGIDSITLKNMNLSEDEQNILAHLASILIPASDTPGAIEVNAHLFAITIIDQCFEKEDQIKFSKGLEQFDKLAQTRYSTCFTQCSPVQKVELVRTLEKKQNNSTEVMYFYSTFKKLCIRGYLNSKYYLTKVNPYQLIPMEFNGSKPVLSIRIK